MTRQRRLDREQLVRRHNPVLTSVDPTAVLSVGNGDAAMSVDVTGLQSMPDLHELRPDPQRVPYRGMDGLPPQRRRAFDSADFQIPLRTQTSWAMHSTTPTVELSRRDAVTFHETPRGQVPYADRNGLLRAGDDIPVSSQTGAYFHFNPRRTHLGRLSLMKKGSAEAEIDPRAISAVRTELDLWSGSIRAELVLDEHRLIITTVADPHTGRFAARVESGTAFADGWGVAWVFDPQPDAIAQFERPIEHSTTWTRSSPTKWDARRTVQDVSYTAKLATDGAFDAFAEHGAIATTRAEVLQVVVELTPGPDDSQIGCSASAVSASFAEVGRSSAQWWEAYWSEGTMVDLSTSTDPRASELERRIILSQYLTAVNCSGSTPPAETGLTYNTWSGKFHLEMHWWHAAHFPMWGRGHLLERSISWYHQSLDTAKHIAAAQGYKGARWPKQTDPSGAESPSHIGVFLIWQQPHVIYLLELLRREGRDEEFLREHYPLIEATADFMADFAEETEAGFTLPPPLVPAQESYLSDRSVNRNPTFELAYWHWALGVASQWRGALGLAPNERWDQVRAGMVAPAVLEDGTYAALGSPPFVIREDHPSLLMALGWVPDTGFIDRDTMRATLASVWTTWDLQSTWGWDYPVMSMTATQLGDIPGAFEALLMDSPKNKYLHNGHAPQMPGFLSLYLPSNGGLLAAIAHIAAALDAGAQPAPGWEILVEDLSPALTILPAPPAAREGRELSLAALPR